LKKNIFLIIFIGLFNQYTISQNNLSEKYNLMPWPQEISDSSENFLITTEFTVSISSIDKGKVEHAATTFLRRLSGRTGIFINKGFPSKINNTKKTSLEISFDKIASVTLEVDESYTLKITNKQLKVHAKTDIGAIRAIATLLQLTTNNKTTSYFPGITISDAPRFLWRGLMIDVARHFQPVSVIKRNLDAMASVKMNVFHWHLTDDQGFRIESNRYPKLHLLASDGLFYTQNQVKDVVNYATRLGIRVVPEFDVPGHASAILTAYPELGSKKDYAYSIERYAGVFNPTLNPTNDKTYAFLKNLFTEITPLFPDEYFHIGGDENAGKHWTENKEISAFKKNHGLNTNHDLQTYFNIRLEKILNDLHKKLMGWDEIMTPTMPTTAVIHSWRGKNEGLKESSLIKAAKKGYKTVLSNGYYIDRLLSVKNHYNVDPIGDVVLTKKERARILGGEVTMWSELVTPLTIDSRIWPRTAAIAERFWSSKSVTDIKNMQKRLKIVSFQLEELGLTHLKNKAVILRNISQYQDISSLIVLSNICEPLKIYSRNKGGTEYKSFSPFTLFADACTADAPDAISFNEHVISYLKTANNTSKQKIISFLTKWIENDASFKAINNNTKTHVLEKLSSQLKTVSIVLKKGLQHNTTLSKKDAIKASKVIQELKKPVADTELVIVSQLTALLQHLGMK